MPSTQRLSDAALVRRSQQGDRRAFAALVSRYDRRLRGLAHTLLLDPAQMDAALGMAYLRAWRDVVRVKPRDDVGPWLYRAAYNACVDLLRRNDGQGPLQPPAGGVPGGLRAALAGLAPADRVAVVLVEREGFSVASAARILGMSPEQLEPRLTAARATLAPFVPVPAPEPAEAVADEVVAEPVSEEPVVDAAEAEAVEDDALVGAAAAEVAASEDADIADPIVETVDHADEPVTPSDEPAATEANDATEATDATGASEVAGADASEASEVPEVSEATDARDDALEVAAGNGNGNGSGNGHDPMPGEATDSTVATKGNGHADRAANRGRGRRSRRRANGAAAAAAKTAGDARPEGDDRGEASGPDDDARDVGEPAGAASTTGEHRVVDG